MATYDPRIVAQAIEDLQGQITRWSSIASEMLATATNSQRHAKEAVDRALHNATIVLDRAKDDEENVKNAISFVAAAIEKCTMAKATSHQTLQEAQTSHEEADATLKKWQAELQKALAWLARAEARLAKAIKELERAKSALRSAEWSLSSAESSYNSCMNDKERSNCSREATAVSRARAEVASARQWVNTAQQEVNAAKEEVARAKARVDCCSKAVSFSTQALNLAEESVASATQAVNSAERSLEFAYAAERFVHIAEKKMIAEVEAAEAMLSETRYAQEFTDNATIHLRTADGAEDSAQIYSTSVQKELEYRVQRLHELNQPSLEATASGSLGGYTSASFSKKWIDNKIQVIDVAKLPEPDGITGPDDFKKISETKMRRGIEQWIEMKPVIESGEGASSDYWANIDNEKGLSFVDGYQQVYEAFYGQDCIRIDKVGDTYDIINGRHRIWLAKRMGITELPMQIVEKGR